MTVGAGADLEHVDMYSSSPWTPLPANHPSSNALLLDLQDPTLPFIVTKGRFVEYLTIVAGDDAVVMWDQDVAPRLIDGDVPWSIHDGGDRNHRWAAYAELHCCVRVYLMHSTAAWHRVRERWYWIKASGSNGHQTNHLLALFEKEIRDGA